MAARVVGALAGGSGALALTASGAAEATAGQFQWSVDGARLAVLVIAAATGVVIAWWRERTAGTVAIVCGLALCLFAYVTASFNMGLAMAVSGGPFLMAGALFLSSHRTSERGLERVL